MKTHYFRRFVMAAAILATTLPASFNPDIFAQTASTDAASADAATQRITVTPAATYFNVSGNAAKFMQDLGTRDGLAAGIQNFTIARQIDDKTRVDFNARAIFGNKDYLFDFKFQQDDFFKVDFGYKQFHTAYNGDGGYFNLNGKSAFGSDFANATNELGIDRGMLWLDIKTLLPNLPAFTLHYDRSTRTGTTDSTTRASYAIAGVTTARGILPAYYYIDQTIDTLSLDVDQQFNSFAYGAGVWGRHTSTDNALYSIYGSSAKTGTQVGSGNDTTTDTVGARAYVTGDIGKHITYGVGGLYDQNEFDINNGGRYQYAGTDLIYDPISRGGIITTTPNGSTGAAPSDNGGSIYANILGESTSHEWAANANLDWRPTKDWSIVPSLRFGGNRTDIWATNTGNSLTATTPTAKNTARNNWTDTTEALEARYTGLKNWTHTLKVELNQGSGDNNYAIFSGANLATLGNHSTTHQTAKTTKIAYTANWYMRPGLSFAGQYYYKDRSNDYDTPLDAASHTANYPGFMSSQGFKTNDFNLRMTWHPIAWLTNVIRYDYQRSTVNTAYNKILPPAANGTNANLSLDTLQTGKTQTHIISENLTLTPHPRVYVNLNCSLVFDQTVIPPFVYYASNMNSTNAANAATTYVSAYQTVVNSDNNYFNAGINATWTPTDMDTLTLDYTYYRAWNFVNNAAASVVYGQDETQNIVTLAWNRRLTANLAFGLGYTYAEYKNPTQGGKLDYHANGITGNLRYKF